MDHEKILLETTRAQERIIILIHNALERRNRNYREDKNAIYERAKLIGMLDMLDAFKIDRTEFNWIFRI